MPMAQKHRFRLTQIPCPNMEAALGSLLVLQTKKATNQVKFKNTWVGVSERQAQQDGGAFYRPKMPSEVLGWWRLVIC